MLSSFSKQAMRVAQQGQAVRCMSGLKGFGEAEKAAETVYFTSCVLANFPAVVDERDATLRKCCDPAASRGTLTHLRGQGAASCRQQGIIIIMS